jgi:hypothetical protein
VTYLALLHHPVYDKNGAVVTTAVTNMDVHDFGRLARTYGVHAFYVATPVPTLRRLVERIMRHWETGLGAAYNHTRKEALAPRPAPHDPTPSSRTSSAKPASCRLVATSAREGGRRLGFADLRRRLADDPRPTLVVFDRLGSHRGRPRRVDDVLEPVRGTAGWNHLSVRARRP